MAKMTQARIERWQKDLEKARQLVQRTQADMGSAKLTTTGATYNGVLETGRLLVPVLTVLDSVVLDDVNRSPIARLRKIVGDVAAARKAAKAAKDAEKAGAS